MGLRFVLRLAAAVPVPAPCADEVADARSATSSLCPDCVGLRVLGRGRRGRWEGSFTGKAFRSGRSDDPRQSLHEAVARCNLCGFCANQPIAALFHQRPWAADRTPSVWPTHAESSMATRPADAFEPGRSAPRPQAGMPAVVEWPQRVDSLSPNRSTTALQWGMCFSCPRGRSAPATRPRGVLSQRGGEK